MCHFTSQLGAWIGRTREGGRLGCVHRKYFGRVGERNDETMRKRERMAEETKDKKEEN